MKKATKINLTLLALVLSANGLYAQQGFGTNQPSKASVIDLQSDSKGLLIPRVALTSLTNFLPVKGETATNVGKTNSLLVYNTATVGTTLKPGYYYWTTDGTVANSFWKRLLANDDSTALALAGDVTGTLGATVVGRIQGIPVTNTTPTNNQVLTYNGTAWTPTAISPATITGKGTLTTQGGIEFTGSTNGTDKLLGNATIQISDLGVTTTKLAADAVTNEKLADNAVQTENIANANVTAQKLTAGNGTAGRVAVADANGVVTYTNAVPSSSVSGQDVTAASTKVTLAGTPAGAALKAFSIDVNEANLTLNNIGGTLDANKITPGTSGQVLTTNGSGATVWNALPTSVSSVSVSAPITNSGTATAPNIGISRNSLTTVTSNGLATNPIDITNGSNAVINGSDTSLQVNNTAALWNANQLRGQSISVTAPTNTQVLQYNGTSWAPATLPAATVTAVNNGLNLNGTTVELGGSLNKPTTITTTATNTLAIAGLQTGAVTDKIVVTDTDGVLKVVDQSTVAIEPWNVQGGTTKATTNSQNIYQTGSVAIGKNAVTTHTASGTSSKFDVNGAVRIGTSSGQIGVNSLTVGSSSNASGDNSLSVGLGNTVSGFAAFSAGSGNSSKGVFSSTLGNNNETAEVSYAAALGGTGNKANAISSVTIGGTSNTATGDNSFATGLSNISQNVSEAVLGRYNAVRTGGNGTSWGTTVAEQNTRTLLQIGNGTISGSTITGNNALTLTQSGRLGVGITGVDNAALPTQTLDVGSGNVRVRDINTVTGSTSDRVVVADVNGVLNTIPASSFASSNIYTSNGTLAGNRTVTQGSNTLTFNSQVASGFKFVTDGTAGTPKPAIQIQDGNQGAGKVLTSDASGTATWSTLPTSVSSVSVTAPITNTGTATAPNIGISRNSLTTATSSASETNAVVITNGSNAVINGANTSLQINNTAPLWNANQLQGRGVVTTAPTSAQVLQYNGTNWAPATLPAATVTAASNGVNLNGTTVELGGNLTKATTITQNANPLTIATGGTALTISGLPTGVAADKALVATSTGVVKQVRQSPRFFYMPAVIFDTSANGTNLKRNLYDEYVKQFQGGQAGTGSATYNIAHGSTGYSMPYTGGIVGSTGAPADIPVYGSSELYYYVTYYDTAVFSNLSINASGELTYNIISNASNVSYMNIVFVVIE